MRFGGVLKKYFLVAKPRLVAANLISAAGGYFLAAKGHISPELLLSVMAGLACVVACGCVLNNCVDRRLDRGMARTRDRLLATGEVSLKEGLLLATALGVAGAAILMAGTSPLVVAVALAGLAVYVVVYSLYLKRYSVYSTVVGSLAGAAPPVAAYCAVSNGFDPGAFIVLAIFSLWQVPHSYAITIFRHDDYAAVEVPVMSVKSGVRATKKHIFWHTVAFTLVAPLLTVFGYTGRSYLAVAVVLGLGWLGLAISGYTTPDDRLWSRRVYLFSIMAIFILSVMMSVDFTP